MTAGLLAFLSVLILIFLRVPVAIAMGTIGVIGFSLSTNMSAALSMAGQTVLGTTLGYALSVIPLFVLMGIFIGRSGLAEDLYRAANSFIGHLKGGHAMATIVACGGFSAACGSSYATAATMANVAVPSMRKFGYKDKLAAGSVAAGGTLGILIPPSTAFILYGLITEQDIALLFAAGVLPGLLGILFYIFAISVQLMIDPQAGPAGERKNWTTRITALKSVGAILLLFALIMGGIYFGFFTPTEAGGVGAFLALMFAYKRKRFGLRELLDMLTECAITSAMIFFVLVGAQIFATYINMSGLTTQLLSFATPLMDQPYLMIFAILLVCFILGMVLESMSMLLLIVPILYPIIGAMSFPGIDPVMVGIWFGVIIVMATEISLITPPVGMNVFMLKTVLRDVELREIFKGVTPFWIVDLLRIALIIAFPTIAVFIPLRMI